MLSTSIRTAIHASLLTFFVFLSGCGSHPELYEKRTEASGYDFTKYTDRGFLITPEGYSGEYQSVGVLNVTVWPTVEELNAEEAPPLTDPIDTGSGSKKWYITEPVSPQEAVDSLYTLADSMGADAIINFETEATKQDLNGGVTRIGIRARGYAIERSQ